MTTDQLEALATLAWIGIGLIGIFLLATIISYWWYRR